VKIELDAAAAPAIGFFDENLVGMALEAALQNAGRFARSRIELGCRGEGGELVFSVRDDGPGLGTEEEKPSTGLGMELCGAIAQAHARGEKRGTASLFNRPEGGAAFELRLP
jgi:K+-sensing histidine kinase KdpD